VSKKLKAYKVLYDGLCLGGVAIVLAYTEQEAIGLVSKDSKTCDFENVRVAELIHEPGAVLYNDNGDY
jgi:hypothetical protein